MARYIVVMGVAGCGKSTVAEALAAALGGAALDADSFHTAGNIAKMSAGTPLTDADRWPWLDIVAREMAAVEGTVVCGCSALRRVYRDRLRAGVGGQVFFAHLDGSRELIWQRMAARKGHFMPESLLDSQFATLEPLAADEQGMRVDISGSTEQSVAQILQRLRGERGC